MLIELLLARKHTVKQMWCIVTGKDDSGIQLYCKVFSKECHIEEGNWWKDKFGGVDIKTRQGENHLGKLIMKIRKELQENVLIGN